MELVGRNVAADALWLSAMMRMTGSNDDQALDEEYRFWHGPSGQWRIEQGGEVIYISDSPDERIIRVDGDMQRQAVGRLGMVWLGPAYSPLDLLGPDSILQRMSRNMTPSLPRTATIDGRPAWDVTLTAGDESSTVRMGFDEATGLLVHLSSPDHGGLLDVSDLQGHHHIDSNVFAFDEPVADAPRRRERARDPEEERQQTIDVPAAQVAAVNRGEEIIRAIGSCSNERAVRASIK